MGDLGRRSHTAYLRCFAVRWFVRFDGFWNTCKNFLYMVIPVVKAVVTPKPKKTPNSSLNQLKTI